MAKKSKSSKTYEEPYLAGVVNEDYLEQAGDVVRALAHPLRLKIINFIDKNPSTNVNNIYNSLGLEQSITSQHLRILRVAKLVDSDRNGKEILYTINIEKIKKIMGAVTDLGL
jgi:DNA-binding transcriptional ArsR family regulator